MSQDKCDSLSADPLWNAVIPGKSLVWLACEIWYLSETMDGKENSSIIVYSLLTAQAVQFVLHLAC
jgi:hypothetical protein